MKKISQKKQKLINLWTIGPVGKYSGKVTNPEIIDIIDKQIMLTLQWRKPTKNRPNPVPSWAKEERDDFYDNNNKCCFNFRWPWIHLALPIITEEISKDQEHPCYKCYKELTEHIMRSDIDLAYLELGKICGILNILLLDMPNP